MPNADDDRHTSRHAVLLQPDTLQGFPRTVRHLRICPIGRHDEEPTGAIPDIDQHWVGEPDPLPELWATAEAHDDSLEGATAAVRQSALRFPSHLRLKVSISECSIDDDGKLCFRGRRWVPDSEPLRTGLIQQVHDSLLSGHPGREVTYSLVARQFFWPGMSDSIRRFCNNCHGCRGDQIWRQRKQGLLKPLPVPDRVWRDISVDFITDLPESMDCTNIMVIADRLSRGLLLAPMQRIDTESAANVFLSMFYSLHGLPSSIVSDRGSAFVARLWERLCQLLRVKRLIVHLVSPRNQW